MAWPLNGAPRLSLGGLGHTTDTDKINQGPWTVEQVPDGTRPPLVGFQITAQDPKIGRVVICEMFCKPYCVMVRQDTANLLSASPDLLAALNAMWAFASVMVERHGMNGDDSMCDEDHRVWQDCAGETRAAIAKATGG